MSKGQRKVRGEFWAIAAVIVIVAFALIADWWKENSTLGWVIVAILLLSIAFGLYRFSSFRSIFVKKAKETAKTVVYEHEVPQREPVPDNIRGSINNRSGFRCENPDCKATIKPHLHHIDNDYNNNSLRNIIALCPNCHSAAHKNQMSNSQLRNWVQRSWETYKRRK